MGATIKTWDLNFIDLDENKYGDFTKLDPYDDSVEIKSRQDLDAFWETPIGEAQRESLVEEMVAQMAAQGVDDYEPTQRALDSALRSAQISQDNGHAPEVTNEKMLDDHGPKWYQDIGGSIANGFNAVHEFVQEEVNPILGIGITAVAGAAQDEILHNEGLSGQAADALQKPMVP
ncbi:MAG: hypothetical protein COA45_02215 [Zetaproteobacteria bacterium]|nr:MAG: hypothetical protein COA45_02215 [Zetaproteobacteria bacterium]